MKKKKTVLLVSAASLVLLICVITALLFTGVLHINNPSKKKYPIRGVDVSHYQGEVDWDRLKEENIQFAYIKATEGSKHKDEQFDKNWSDAQCVDLRIGAYHFFSLDSPGADQAENFCSTVTPVEKMLPPVLQETFDDYDLWIRDVYRKPDPTVKWTFWQYSNRHVLSGYSGNERYIDMNVFCGSEEEFDKY